MRVLDVAAEIATREGVVFKHLRSTALLVALSSKSAPRTSSGKFVTIYPVDDVQLRRIADELSQRLRGVAGPRVLTDVRWDDRAPVFIRFGAFTPETVWTADGRRVPAMIGPQGEREPDERAIPHRAPRWAQPLHTPADEEGRTATELPYRVIEALQFSNCGGVYRAYAGAPAAPASSALILKEARPHTGIGPTSVAATERIALEAGWLRRLRSVPGVAQLQGEIEIEGHRFIAVEQMPGISLRSWVAAQHPALGPTPEADALAAYADRCAAIMRRLREVIDAVHRAGVAHRDLHPGNILIGPDDSVSLIDFELASEVSETGAPSLGCPAFVTHSGTGAERDHHALRMLALWVLCPVIGGAVEFDQALLVRHLRDIRRLFGERSKPFLADIDATRASIRRRGWDGVGGLADLRGVDEWLTARLRTHERPLPLDPRSMATELAEIGMAHGLSGVLAAAGPGRVDGGPRASMSGILRARAERARDDDPGLWDGWSGVALAAWRRGDDPLFRLARDRAVQAAEACTSLSLAHGLAGVASMLLTTSRDDAESRLALTWTLRVARELDGPASVSAAALEDGHGGVAVVLSRALAVAVGSEQDELLAAIRTCRERDLDSCEWLASDVLVARRGPLALPYLARGSLGVAIARSLTAASVGEPVIDGTTRSLAASAAIDLVVDAGVAAGRAGLAVGFEVLAQRAPHPEDRRRWRREAARQRRRLDRNLVRTDEGTAVLGRGGVRVAADLATGAAGVLCSADEAHPLREHRRRVLDDLFGGALSRAATPCRAPQERAVTSVADERTSQGDVRPSNAERR